jgi:hypothetical protein
MSRSDSSRLSLSLSLSWLEWGHIDINLTFDMPSESNSGPGSTLVSLSSLWGHKWGKRSIGQLVNICAQCHVAWVSCSFILPSSHKVACDVCLAVCDGPCLRWVNVTGIHPDPIGLLAAVDWPILVGGHGGNCNCNQNTECHLDLGLYSGALVLDLRLEPEPERQLPIRVVARVRDGMCLRRVGTSSEWELR